MKILQQQYGQSLIEAVISLPLAILGVGVFFSLLWGLLTSMVAHHALYELLICQELEPPPVNCLQMAKEKMNKTLFFGSIKKLNLEKNNYSSSAKAEISLPLRLSLDLTESISLPLADHDKK